MVPTKVILFGTEKVINFPVVVLNSGETLMVSTREPAIIRASDFGIPNNNMTALAATVGGIPISDQVAVSFSVMFHRVNQN